MCCPFIAPFFSVVLLLAACDLHSTPARAPGYTTFKQAAPTARWPQNHRLQARLLVPMLASNSFSRMLASLLESRSAVASSSLHV